MGDCEAEDGAIERCGTEGFLAFLPFIPDIAVVLDAFKDLPSEVPLYLPQFPSLDSQVYGSRYMLALHRPSTASAIDEFYWDVPDGKPATGHRRPSLVAWM